MSPIHPKNISKKTKLTQYLSLKAMMQLKLKLKMQVSLCVSRNTWQCGNRDSFFLVLHTEFSVGVRKWVSTLAYNEGLCIHETMGVLHVCECVFRHVMMYSSVGPHTHTACLCPQTPAQTHKHRDYQTNSNHQWETIRPYGSELSWAEVGRTAER